MSNRIKYTGIAFIFQVFLLNYSAFADLGHGENKVHNGPKKKTVGEYKVHVGHQHSQIKIGEKRVLPQSNKAKEFHPIHVTGKEIVDDHFSNHSEDHSKNRVAREIRRAPAQAAKQAIIVPQNVSAPKEEWHSDK
jgi:hypothetical protein